MKKNNIPRTIALIFFVCASAAATASARVNLLEPWYPGQDMSVNTAFTYMPEAAVIMGEKRFETPAQVTFAVDPRVELGARWGLKYFDGNFGVSDLLIGMKYRFLDGTGSTREPSVIGEAAISLPTGNSSNDLGTGAAGLLLHWAMEKEIYPVVGTFGLGIRINGESGSDIRTGNVFSYHAGAAYRYAEDIRLIGELKGFNHSSSKQNGTTVPGSDFQEFYLAPGIQYSLDRTHTLSGALLIGLTSGSDDIGLFATINF